MKQHGEKRFLYHVDRLAKKVEVLARTHEEILSLCDLVKQDADNVFQSMDSYISSQTKRTVEKLEKRIEELEGGPRIEADQVALSRAKTFAIFDSILFAIENWATDSSPSPDFTIVSQSILFPIVLQKVSRNEEDYYLTEVPPGALEVVRRGREFIKQYRRDDKITMLDPNVFPIVQAELQDWWTRDALGLLYGATDTNWQREEPFSFEQMNRWRTMEAARPLEFPLLFDGMELVQRYGDEIRVETGLPEFSRNAMKLRLQS